MPVCGAPLARDRSRFSAATRSTIVSPAFARPAAKVRRRGENGHHPPVRSFRYEVSREPGPGIEAWTFAWLQGTPVGGRATVPRVTDFHVLAIVRSGQGRVTVDFEPTRRRAKGRRLDPPGPRSSLGRCGERCGDDCLVLPRAGNEIGARRRLHRTDPLEPAERGTAAHRC